MARLPADLWAVAWGGAAAAGAWAGMRGATAPLWLGAAVLGLAVLRRYPALVCVGLVLLTSTLAQRSLAGLTAPVTGPVQAEVTLVTDPQPTPGGGVRADARLGDRRVALRAFRAAAAGLEDRLAGERVTVLGSVEPRGEIEERFPHRHQAARMRVDTVMGWRQGHGLTRAANGVRRTLAAGAESLSERQQSLFAGLTIGDDRRQPPDLQQAFRASGLSHLLAVSGTNVSFVLVVAAPLLRRMRLAPRLVLTLVVLAGFALVTRGEPSVLRATTMAALAAYGAATGRPTTSLRNLGLTVALLLLVDPLLVSSAGFQLSVAGSAGITLGAGPLARRIPGPRWLAMPVAVTVAAELAVAPVLAAVFGFVPLVSLPANLLAVPAAGWLKVWGFAVGPVAGVVGEPVATALHLPTRLLLAWIEGVARALPEVPLGVLRSHHVAGLAAGILVAAVGAAPRFRPTRLAGGLRGVAALAIAAVLMLATVAGVRDRGGEQEGVTELGPGVELWRSGGGAVVVVDGRLVADRLVSELRAEGVRRADVVVVRTSSGRAAGAASDLRGRWPALVVLAPASVVDSIDGAMTPADGSVLQVADLHVELAVDAERIEPDISLLPSDGQR